MHHLKDLSLALSCLTFSLLTGIRDRGNDCQRHDWQNKGPKSSWQAGMINRPDKIWYHKDKVNLGGGLKYTHRDMHAHNAHTQACTRTYTHTHTRLCRSARMRTHEAHIEKLFRFLRTISNNNYMMWLPTATMSDQRTEPGTNAVKSPPLRPGRCYWEYCVQFWMPWFTRSTEKISIISWWCWKTLQ